MRRVCLFGLICLLASNACPAEEAPLVAEVDLKFIRETKQVTAVLCLDMDDDEVCGPYANGYLWEARLRRTISGTSPGKKFLVLYGQHALKQKSLARVVGKFSKLTDDEDGAQYQLVARATEGRLSCFNWLGHDGSGAAEQPRTGMLLHCFAPEGLPGEGVESPLMDPEQSLRAANEAYNQAIIRGDVVALEKIFAADFVYTTTSGQVMQRAAQLEQFRSKRLVIESGNGSEERVQVHGRIGIVTGQFDATGTYEGKPFDARERYTSVWQVRGDRWELLSEQGTLIR